MNYLSPVMIVAIIFGIIYKVFDLFVRRKERIMLIEKLGDSLKPADLKEVINVPFSSASSSVFKVLRFACLLIGIGVGLLVGYSLSMATQAEYFNGNYNSNMSEAVSICYGASVLVFGGIGLLISYVIEIKKAKKE